MPHAKVNCRECAAVMLKCCDEECEADRAMRFGQCDECKYGPRLSALEEVARNAATWRPRLEDSQDADS